MDHNNEIIKELNKDLTSNIETKQRKPGSGRPKGSKNKPKKQRKPGSGRPKGSKNKNIINNSDQDPEIINDSVNIDFKPIDQYKDQNDVKETIKKDFNPLDSIFNETPDEAAAIVSNLVKIKLDPKNLMLADIFLDSILQKILNVIGFKIELNPMSENDLEIWSKLAPDLELQKSWPNFFKFYLIAKAKN